MDPIKTEASAAATTTEFGGGRTESLPLSSLVPGKSWRGEDEEVDDLVESFTKAPQLQNVVARPVEGGKYEVIAGNRRVAAARQTGWTEIRVMVLEVDDATAEQYGLEENLRRKPVADDGTALAKLKELYLAQGAAGRGGDRRSKAVVSSGHDGRLVKSATAKAAELTGTSARQARRAIKIGKEGVSELKQALEDGTITINEAEKVAGRPAEQQRQLLAERQSLKASGAPAKLHPAEVSLARVIAALASLRKQKARTGTLAPELMTRLKAMAATLVEGLATLETTAGPGGPAGAADQPHPLDPLHSSEGNADGQ